MSVFRPGNTALITGGASGIGLAVARLCLDRGMRVAIVDVNAQTLELAKQSLDAAVDADGKDERKEAEIVCFEADVGSEEHWTDLKEKVQARWGSLAPDFLMLNAGVGTKGTWGDGGYFQKILQTNLYGVTNGLNAFVPGFLSRPSSGSPSPSAIVITGSKQGITNPPGNAAYNASKAAVKALAEHLSFDLRDTATSVHLLVPGWTFTGLSGNTPGSSAEKPKGAWHAHQVAAYMVSKMQEGSFYIICPDDDVDEATDRKRMLWSAGDVVHGRPPLTRWRKEWKEEAQKWMGSVDVEKF